MHVREPLTYLDSPFKDRCDGEIFGHHLEILFEVETYKQLADDKGDPVRISVLQDVKEVWVFAQALADGLLVSETIDSKREVIFIQRPSSRIQYFQGEVVSFLILDPIDFAQTSRAKRLFDDIFPKGISGLK